MTPDGYLYSREAIIENLLQQKKLIKRKVAAWEEQQREEEQQASAVGLARIHDFVSQRGAGASALLVSSRKCTVLYSIHTLIMHACFTRHRLQSVLHMQRRHGSLPLTGKTTKASASRQQKAYRQVAVQ